MRRRCCRFLRAYVRGAAVSESRGDGEDYRCPKIERLGKMARKVQLLEEVRFCFEAAGLFLWRLTWFAFHHAPPADVRDCIHACTSSRRHAVTRADNFTGCGNSPDFTLRHRVAGENGTMPGTSSDWRTKPMAGRSTILTAALIKHPPRSTRGQCRPRATAGTCLA